VGNSWIFWWFNSCRVIFGIVVKGAIHEHMFRLFFMSYLPYFRRDRYRRQLYADWLDYRFEVRSFRWRLHTLSLLMLLSFPKVVLIKIGVKNRQMYSLIFDCGLILSGLSKFSTFFLNRNRWRSFAYALFL
jgi:hypothetical protein